MHASKDSFSRCFRISYDRNLLSSAGSFLRRQLLPRPILSGTVKSSKESRWRALASPLETPAKRSHTTVYTDQSGRYFFPPVSSGQYKLWAQAVGFETATSEAGLAGAGKKQWI